MAGLCALLNAMRYLTPCTLPRLFLHTTAVHESAYFAACFSDVLRSFLDLLHDEDIISEDAFNQWDQSNDPAEQNGKGVAHTAVVQFFNWLREAEEESQEDS